MYCCKVGSFFFRPLSNYTHACGSKGGGSTSLLGDEFLLAGWVHKRVWGDALGLQVVVVLQLIILGNVVPVWWAVVLLEVGVGLILLLGVPGRVGKVKAGENTVVWHGVVDCCWLEVVHVGERGGEGMSEPQLLSGVTFVDTVDLLVCQESKHVVLHNWVLGNSSVESTGCVEADSVTKSEDIFVLVVLQSVFVNIQHSVGVSKTSLSNKRSWLGGWVEATGVEVLLNNFVGVNVSHDSNLLTGSITLDLSHLPAEVDLNSTLVALVKSNLVSVIELVDRLVWSPVLNTGSWSGTTVHLVNTHEVLVVQSVEVITFSLVWVSWRVAHQVTHEVVPAIEEVALNTLGTIEQVDEGVLRIWLGSQLLKAWDVSIRMIETWSKNKSLVGV